MEFFLQGLDFQLWSIIEEGDLLVNNERNKWTDEDKKKISLNSKAKSILCCALSKKEFNIISACKSTMEMWEKLRLTYKGTDKVKETRIDILVTQYERFQMQAGESITQMYSRFTDITNGLAGLGKTYEIGDMKHNNALKATEDTSDGKSDSEKSNGSSEDEEAFLSRRLQRILAKKKYQSGRKYFKKRKDFKRPEGNEVKKAEPICYECKKPGHIKAEHPKLKKTEFKKKDNVKKFKRYKKKTMAAAWNNESESDSESNFSEEEEETANLTFMVNIDEKIV
ncbi:hypothetical protein Taro_000524 [Colocasia esculenta]|uniref:CCHC-type domain-containing protein n=1 Tax=Colocasia esculenta TaxID=4460 RepID=A0A843TF47_COLES|nr:hypothetical protein [Colocasia esculenta]